MRLPDRFLEHRISIRPRLAYGSSTGSKYGPARADVHALVADRIEEVNDQRADSPSRGSAIVSDAQVVMQLDDYVAPGASVTIHPGTPAERTAEVVAASYNEHTRAPSSAQLWLA